MAGICSGFVMRRTQIPEIAGFVMGISANGHAAGAVQLRRNKTGF
jgi:hypothetical protein